MTHPTGFKSRCHASGRQAAGNDSLKKGLVSPAGPGRSTAPVYRGQPKAAITLIEPTPQAAPALHPQDSAWIVSNAVMEAIKLAAGSV
jgi:hypothetical protein